MFLPQTYTIGAEPWSGTLANHSQNFGFQRPELQEKEMNGQLPNHGVGHQAQSSGLFGAKNLCHKQ